MFYKAEPNFLQNKNPHNRGESPRAEPDLAHEFNGRTGLDTQICRKGPAWVSHGGVDRALAFLYEG